MFATRYDTGYSHSFYWESKPYRNISVKLLQEVGILHYQQLYYVLLSHWRVYIHNCITGCLTT